MLAEPFETKSVSMQRLTLQTVQAPQEDVARIMASVVEIAPLVMGAYDSNAWVSGPGTERYRPRAGAAAGAEIDVRERPGVTEISFELPDDPVLVSAVVEVIFQVHSYQEPVIRLASILGSRSKGLDDRDNPNRWWNTTGDWKRAPSGVDDA
jgi:hypothetical protein